jgi:hypothetical protein
MTHVVGVQGPWVKTLVLKETEREKERERERET